MRIIKAILRAIKDEIRRIQGDNDYDDFFTKEVNEDNWHENI